MKKVAILDYGIGNVRSQLNALQHLGVEAILTSVPNEVLSADAVILPGVGAFKHGMENLQKYGLLPVISDFIATGRPFLGICLGMQLLFEESDEFGHSEGLSLIKGKIRKLEGGNAEGLKLPNIGWMDVQPPAGRDWKGTLLDGIAPGDAFYFVHSYAAIPANAADMLAESFYGKNKFCCSVEKGNIYGTQFHPEKSGESGLKVLKNFIGKIS